MVVNRTTFDNLTKVIEYGFDLWDSSQVVNYFNEFASDLIASIFLSIPDSQTKKEFLISQRLFLKMLLSLSEEFEEEETSKTVLLVYDPGNISV